jgi:formate hydrogenlyase subunit 6/NADH:ubiquinone oxidoreductase subunit I
MTLKNRLVRSASWEKMAAPTGRMTEPQRVKRWQNGDRSPARCISCKGCFRPNPAGNL